MMPEMQHGENAELKRRITELEGQADVLAEALVDERNRITELEARILSVKPAIETADRITELEEEKATLITELRDWKCGWAGELELLPPRALDELTALLEKQK